MKLNIHKTLSLLFVISSLSLGTTAPGHAQAVFDTPVTEFELPQLLNPDFQLGGFPNTLQIGDLEPNFINPITGEVLNDVVFVTNPVPFSDNSLTVRFFTAYHTSSEDTRALSLTPPTDLDYIALNDNFLGFDLSSSVQVLDLDRDGQNDLAFFGTEFDDEPDDGPNPVIGVLGTANDPFVMGTLTQLGTSIDQAGATAYSYNEYSGQPILGVGDLDGDGNLDLAFNDLEAPDMSGAGVTGAGLPSFQRLHTLLNDGTFGPLPDPVTEIAVPDPVFDDLAFGQYIVVEDFDGNGTQDAGVLYVVQTTDNPDSELRVNVYPGNGDGTFAAQATVNQVIASYMEPILDDPDAIPLGMTVGNFDGDAHLDFAVTYVSNTNGIFLSTTESFTTLVTCAPGSPPSCTVQETSFGNSIIPSSIAAGDFDGDGIDDIAQLEVTCTIYEPLQNGLIDVTDQVAGSGEDQRCVQFAGYAAVYLNQGGAISSTPDQTINPTIPDGTTFFPFQVVAGPIDGCSPDDIAFTGIPIVPESPNGAGSEVASALTGQGGLFPSQDDGVGIVAFATALAPVADAGIPVPVDGGFQIGGAPTCSEDATPEWTQISGTPATISDPSAANPIVSGLVDEAVFQVTCRSACGEASDTVTIPGTRSIYVQGSGCGSSLHGPSVSHSTKDYIWILLGALAFGYLLRRGFKKA